MATITLPVTIYLPNPADLPRLFQDSDRPYLYADSSGLDMTAAGWAKLQETTLSFELDDALRQPPQLDSPAAGVVMDLPVDMAPDEGTVA